MAAGPLILRFENNIISPRRKLETVAPVALPAALREVVNAPVLFF